MKPKELDCRQTGCANPWMSGASLLDPDMLRETVKAGLGALCAEVAADGAEVWLGAHGSPSPELLASVHTLPQAPELLRSAAVGWLRTSFGSYMTQPRMLLMSGSKSSELAAYPVCTAAGMPAGCLLLCWSETGARPREENLAQPLAVASASVGGLLEQHRLSIGISALSEPGPLFADDLFRWAANMAARVVHAPYVIVWEYDADKDMLVRARSNSAAVPSTLDIPLGAGIIGTVAQANAYGTVDMNADDSLTPDLMDELGLTRICWCWVEHRGDRRALVAVYSCGVLPFSPTEELLVRAAASRLTVLLAGERSLVELAAFRDRVERRAGAVLAGLRAMEIAHDIAMHMHSVNSWVGWICEDLVPQRKQERPENKAALDDFKGALEILTDLSKTLTRLAKSQAPLRRKRQPLAPILDVVQSMHESELKKDRVQLSITDDTEDVPVYCDADRIQQVVSNLIANAHYALKGQKGKREISIRAAVAGSSLVRISVLDSGPGIVQEDVESIFEIGVSTKPPDQGAGFGLYLVKSVVERHGGSVRAKSVRPHGARFEILLPVENS